ncbi:hypothetical protein SPRG_01154 [Saprolegnia parasitica CBS 223.65]|uniref:Uncharacterized protein n=1 Tax=Saprolegnia parasitica (strain CBS 223.65) TaxID=695850 RepID=A0A067CWL1_SAPPC|nr:hypothetical protein SPRG_01154 [Saprolegnia parasitica CBS 223.65]KDO35089.1 hypothetical protein SPRG_01154 [Saprolegnia parasitica CBS 223.65]|eukprot:XP_012194741.1 hypothetical protein SPRG_01154 [Saprolegnia parasitica CBS 223.65]
MDGFDYMGDEDQCLLLTDGFARFIQVLLGFCAMGVLYVKRELEQPKRSFNVWTYDVSKQGIGALMIHMLNILLSIFLTRRSDVSDDECAIYFMTFLMDATLGTLLVLILLRQMKKLATRLQWTSIMHSGEYGDPPSFRIWLKQLLAYVVLLLTMKVLVLLLLYAAYKQLAALATSAFAVFAHHRHLELVLVMILGPCAINVIQFWVLDNVLKTTTAKGGYVATPTTEDDDSSLIDDTTSP